MPDARPNHPGDTLREDVLEPSGRGPFELARALGVELGVLSDVLLRRRPLEADLALRLERHLGTPAEIWLGLQAHHDIETTRRSHGRLIDETVAPRRR